VDADAPDALTQCLRQGYTVSRSQSTNRMTAHAVSELYGITPIDRMDITPIDRSHPLDPLDLADAQEAWRGWVCSHDSPAIKAGQRHSKRRQIRACPAMSAFRHTGHRSDIAE
jgi:hypothetical protein